MSAPGSVEGQPYVLRVWDATRLATAMTCWRKHWYQNLLGLRRNGPVSVHLEWGKAYDECCGFFDGLMTHCQYWDKEKITLKTLERACNLSWDFERKQPRWGERFMLVRCSDPETRPGIRDPSKQVINRERCKWARKWFEELPTPGGHCECGRSIEYASRWFNAHPKKNRANLLRAVALYCDTPGLPPFRFADGKPNVQVQHRLPLPVGAELVVNLDSVVELEGRPAIRERKSTGLPRLDARFWSPYMMGPQVDTYDLVGSIVYADEERVPELLVEATRLTTGGEVEIAREVVPQSDERRAEWFEELQSTIFEAMERGLDVKEIGAEMAFPRRSTSCHGKFGTCPYFGLCTSSRSKREAMIAQDFHVEHWDPVTATATREDSDG